MFETTTRKVTATVMVKGLGAPLAGIDVRPADGMLYGLQRDGQIVTIDMKSGQATMKSKLDQMLPAGVALTVDFNPVADRMRVVGADGINLRITVDDGKTIALDIEADGMGGNTGRLLADGTLGMIDIGNRQLRTSGQVSGLKGAVRDIAVLPAM